MVAGSLVNSRTAWKTMDDDRAMYKVKILYCRAFRAYLEISSVLDLSTARWYRSGKNERPLLAASACTNITRCEAEVVLHTGPKRNLTTLV